MASLQFCEQRPVIIESILMLLNNQIIGVADPTTADSAANKAYVDRLHDEILGIIQGDNTTTIQQLEQLRLLIASIDGMGRDQVIAIVREIIGEDLSPEDIAAMIQNQYGALLIALQETDRSLLQRLTEDERQLAILTQALDTSDLRISALVQVQEAIRAQVTSQAAMLQTLLSATQQIVIKIRNGLFQAFEGILSGDVSIDCEGPTHANIKIIFRSRKSPVTSVYRLYNGHYCESKAPVAKIAPTQDESFEMGQIYQLTVAKIDGNMGDLDLEFTGGSPVGFSVA